MGNLLALDQSSRTSGYAIFKDQELIHYGHFTFTDNNIGVRLNKIKNKIKFLIDEYNITELVFEDVYLDSEGVNNIQTFKTLAEVLGIVYELATDLKIPNTAVLAKTWRSTLKIKGTIRQEQKKNAQNYILDKYNIKATEDECDAICIGVHHLTAKKSSFDWSD